MSDYSSIQRRAKTARRKAELAGFSEALAWHNAEAANIDSDPELGEIAKAVATRELLHEFGRRSSRALSKAKRQNSASKLLHREVLAEIEHERVRRTEEWI